MNNYDHLKIEKKWQKEWDKKKTYQTLDVAKAVNKKRKPFYVLDMFPYPSGAGLHVGHPRGYIGSDVYARFKRMQGFNVLHPMGYDAFGLPAEQFAIANKIHPRKAVEKNVATFERQLSLIGLSYDWSRKVNTTDPEYYKWTQWIFLQLYNSYYDIEKDKARPISELIKKLSKKDPSWKKLSELEKQKVLMQYRLAYEGYSDVNWSPSMGTVLANDEVLDTPAGPVSERDGKPVEKKRMRQWFMRITAYAERLLTGLDGLDWSEHVKEIQRNWIGKSEGAEIEFKLVASSKQLTAVKVFTTRADTLFGVTYVVLAPEHDLVSSLKSQILNWSEVEKYLKEVSKKTDEERTSVAKDKTGIELKGLKAINPATGEEVPVWISDYVLAGYGTGAVMAVPAHDERDFIFAKKYGLPIKRVIEPLYIATEKNDDACIKPELPFIKRDAVCVVVRNPKDDTYLCTVWKNFKMNGVVTGGIDDGEDIVTAAKRELYEETGYKNVQLVKVSDHAVQSKFFHRIKKVNRWARFQYVLFDLVNEDKDEITQEESSIHTLVWKKKSELKDFFTVIEGEYINNLIYSDDYAFCDYGILHNSGKFTDMESAQAKIEITKFAGGKIVTKYKMRDAVFARQRYWGEPIPLKHDASGMIVPLTEKQLPLKLPNVTSYEPTGTGESPLASVKAWKKSGYETNTMPGWAGSSWYYLRYIDPKNKKEFASKKSLKYWKNVDMYIGGQEHATGHLLYSRFWHKALYDLGYVPTQEPFKALRNQGMIGGADGRKMSKRWGNVVNPDDVVKTYGADSLRVFEMFLGPFDSHLPWSTEGIIGSRRFIEKVWRLAGKIKDSKFKKTSPEAEKVLHKTIKKVTEDIEKFNFNTAISAMMICVNEMEKAEMVSVKDFVMFLQILAPFASHTTEELWGQLGEKGSIHLSIWPKYNPKMLIEDTLKIVVSVNGKPRGEIFVPAETIQAEIEQVALRDSKVSTYLEGKEIKRIIYVPGKLINIVIA